ncbi:MAG: hypothetical protein OXC09_02620 [Truepera sp.]|nr:hypothetical protein [Truepera sp.]
MTPVASLLRRRLGAVRVRLAVRRLIKGVSGSLLLAAGLYLILLLGSYLIPELMDVPLVGITTVVFAGGLAITISIQVLRPPSRLEAARRADRLLGLEERLSTAVEFESASGDRIVELAQQLDAERHAGAVQVSRVAPLRLPGVGWPALALLVASLAAQLLPPPTLPEITSSFDRAELEQALDQVERLQTAVAREAERREDPYLGAVAEALEMFRRDLASGGLDRQESRRQLTQIIEHMMRASDLEGNPAALAEQLLASSPSELPADEAAGDAPTRGGDGAQPHLEGDLPPFAGLDPLLDAVNRPLEGGPENERAPLTEGSRGGYTDRELIEALQEQALRASQAAREADGAIIGAAADSNPGASRLAGQGSQELVGDPATAAESDPDAFAFEDLALPGEIASEGRRIELELPPDVELVEVSGSLPALGPWRTLPEAALTTEFFPMSYREELSRYFTPLDGG